MKNLPVAAAPIVLEKAADLFQTYQNNKRDIKAIKHETKRISLQAKAIFKQIDANLKATLDKNQKMYDIEIKRIETVAKTLKDSSKKKNEMLKQSRDIIKILKNQSKNSIDNEMIPAFLSFLNDQYSDESALCTNLLDSLTSFDDTQNITYQKGEK